MPLTLYALKPAFQQLLRPSAAWLARVGVSANAVTLGALLLSCAQGLALLLWPNAALPLLLLPVTLFIRMALNALDGMLAREYNQASPLGAVLNELGDVLSDSVMYLPLALLPGVPAVLLVSLVLLAISSEFVGVLGVTLGASRRYDGPLGKSDRALVLGGVALLLGLGLPAGVWLTVLLGALNLLAAATLVNRARQALREVASPC
jgi:CDP-diacylglycerol--glycerol-3-phosphate 3-phosphatidyltransferase